MPKVGVNRDQLEGLKNPPSGIYDFRFDGFKPKYAKQKEGKERSINMRPQLIVINNQQFNDAPIMCNGNTAFAAELFDMCHALGLRYEGEAEGSDDMKIPGDFQGPDDDPSQWTYIGPLAGATGQVEIGETTGQDGKPRTQVKKFFCKVAGCDARHRDSLF